MTKATAMTTAQTLAAAQTDSIVMVSCSHAVFLNSITDLFHWFQEAVAGYEAVADMDTKLSEFETIFAEDFMPERLRNEWGGYTRALQSAYANFGRDVVHKMGFDEPAQVRNLALNIAGSAFQQARTRAREFMVGQIEGAFAGPGI